VADISVCIPHRPSDRYLAEAVASIEAQEGVDVELILVEDTELRGPGWARNRCLEQASCEWIFRMDSDDILPPRTLAPMAAAAIHPRAITATAAVQFFNTEGLQHRWDWQALGTESVLTVAHSPASTGNVLYSRQLHDEVGPCPEDCGGYEGWALFARAVVHGFMFAVVPGTEYLHRLHPGSYWVTRPDHRADLAAALMHVYADRLLG
jgi:hypothetical protein